MASNNVADKSGGLVAPAPAAPGVIRFGGNKGGRPRKDGLTPGSPEAIAADRDADAKRKREARAAASAQRMATNPPRLAPLASPVANTPAQTIPVVDGPPVDAPVNWLASDFNQVAVDSIELADLWNIQRHVKRRLDGKLPHSIVAATADEVGFPAKSKQSLQSSSPAGLAWAFNALGVPVAFKPFVSTFPALTYLVLRDFSIMAKEDKLIAEEKERREKADAQKASAPSAAKTP